MVHSLRVAKLWWGQNTHETWGMILVTKLLIFWKPKLLLAISPDRESFICAVFTQLGFSGIIKILKWGVVKMLGLRVSVVRSRNGAHYCLWNLDKKDKIKITVKEESLKSDTNESTFTFWEESTKQLFWTLSCIWFHLFIVIISYYYGFVFRCGRHCCLWNIWHVNHNMSKWILF